MKGLQYPQKIGSLTSKKSKSVGNVRNTYNFLIICMSACSLFYSCHKCSCSINKNAFYFANFFNKTFKIALEILTNVRERMQVY